ncbi:MAG: hypothetical protein AAF798_07195 [Bacteroidota bacterium]
MRLNLQRIPCYIINIAQDTDKRAYVKGQLDELGIAHQFVPAVRTKPGLVGIALSHLKVLKMPELKPPFMILEDDVRFFFDRVQTTFEVPDETDGFYFGHSIYGTDQPPHEGVQWGAHSKILYEYYNDTYLRVHSMLARHGILFLSDKFHQNAIEANIKALTHFNYHIPGDIVYAAMQSDHILLTPEQPWCYQSELFGGNWMATKHSILKIKKGLMKNKES